MFDFASILHENPNGVLATKNGDKIATRIFQYLFSDGSKIYFCTNSKKPVYSQLVNDSNVSFCTYATDYNPVLSINGKVFFEESVDLKKRALSENPGIMKIYKDPQNPIFKLFYINIETIDTFSFSEGPKTYKL